MRLTGSRDKHIRTCDRDAAILDFEIARRDDLLLAPKRPETVERRRGFGLPFFERRADDRGQIADILGDQEVMLHEPLNARQTAARRIAEPFGDPALMVEAQPLFRSARQKMQMAAHPPQKLLAAAGTAGIRNGKTRPAATRSADSRSR